jgi:HK97 family phage prohead protease
MNTERRANLGLELREEGGKAPVLTGYAAVFGKRSLDLGGFVETIRKGAFARSLTEGADILALAHHDPTRPLARRSAGTLSLTEDDTGLRVDITLGDTTSARDVLADIRAKNILGMSFGFATREDKWTRSKGSDPHLRELLDVDLFEVSPVTWPAYPDTSVATRAMQALTAAPEITARANSALVRLLTISLP